MYRIVGDLDPATGVLAQTVLHALAAPRPSGDGESGDDPHSIQADGCATDLGATADGDSSALLVSEAKRDRRRPDQRLHDAFRAALKKLLRSGELPMSGGLPASILVTMTADQYETGRGIARTGFGDPIPVPDALRLADEALLGWIVRDDDGKILRYGQTKRIATAHQTRALIARDQGCAFPSCEAPPQWTERHHVIPWRQGGATDIDNLCLLCDYHHDQIERQEWSVSIKNGVPWFVPPSLVDPGRVPRRNRRPTPPAPNLR